MYQNSGAGDNSFCTAMENVCRIMYIVENYTKNLGGWVQDFGVITVMMLKFQILGSYATSGDKWLSLFGWHCD